MKLGFKRGILLEQNKEPALSHDIRQFVAFPIPVESTKTPVSLTPDLLAPHEIIMFAKEARIIDESDGSRLWRKLAYAAREGVSTIVADAMDDEPYISSQLAPALQFSEQMTQGLALVKRAVGASKMKIEIYRNLFDLNTHIPHKLAGIKVERIGGKYPAEGRYGKYYDKDNVLIVGTGALIYLYRAVYEGRRQTSTFVTVSGDCVANPGNYEIPLGCSLAQVLDSVGLITEPRRIVAGGAMTGFGVIDPDRVLVSHTTRGILAFADEFKDMGYYCIGCGRCTENCPEGLSPHLIYKTMQAKHVKHLDIIDADLCTGCGTCSYVCPAKIDLVQYIAKAAALSRSRQGGNS